jgi:MoaA/NifB/PqqE/SkfB family radical SAM enzyme
MSISISQKLRIALCTASGKPGTPRFASLFVTRCCNLACPYCRSISQPFVDVDLFTWKKIIKKLHGFGCRLFTLTGGEPLCREDILEIVRFITHDCSSVCWMISNFGLMTPGTISQLATSGLQFLTCSLDSLEGQGVKSSAKVLNLLQDAKRQGMICSTLSVITKRNIDEIPAILGAVTSRGIIFDLALYQNVGGLFSPSSDSLKITDLSALERLRTLLRKEKLRSGLVAPSWSYLNADLRLYRDLNWKCSFDRDRFLVVNNNGRLMACQEHDTNVDLLSLESLSDPRWRVARKEAVEQCRGCFYGCYYQKENIGPGDALLDAWTMLRV